MSTKPIHLISALTLTAMGMVGSFVLTTAAMDQVPDVVLVGLTSFVAALVLVALRGKGLVEFVRSTPTRAVALMAAGGIASFWAAPLIALGQRATDAPSGAEVLFFTTSAWGLMAVITGALLLRERPLLAVLGGALLSVAGAAALLANWERPSSFSPLAKFPVQELIMLGAGVVFVAGTVMLIMVARQYSMRQVATVAAMSAGLAGGLTAAFVLKDHMQALVRVNTELVLLSAAQAAFIVGWSSLVEHRGLARASSVFTAAPVFVTGLFLLERATGIFGPIPFQIPGVVAGASICLAGAAVLWLAEGSALRDDALSGGAARVAEFVAWLAAAGATVSLLRPALRASVEGVLGQGFSAKWTMLGAESAAGWLPLAAAMVVIGAARCRRGECRLRAWGTAVAAALVTAGVSPLLLSTTLHTWNRWVPAAVQQTYGTEYARFVVSTIVEPVRTVSMGLVVVSALVLAVSAMAGGVRASHDDREES